MRNNRFFATALLVFSLIVTVVFLIMLIDIWWAMNVPKTGAIGNGPPKMTAYLWIKVFIAASMVILSLFSTIRLYRELPPHMEEDIPHKEEK